MLLCIKHKFLFIHIAKTGGTSIRTTLNRLRWRDPYFVPQFIASRISHLTGHRLGCKFPRHAKIIAAYEMLPREFFQGLFKFAFVRNPWDLQVSSFHHIRRERPHLLAGHTDFKDFLSYKLDPQRPYQFHLDTSISLQSDYLVGLHGEILVDFIGRYETIQQDFAAVCHQLQLPPMPLASRRRAIDREKDYRKYYDTASAELVAEHFKPDIEMFGYSFD